MDYSVSLELNGKYNIRFPIIAFFVRKHDSVYDPELF